jgi:sigma-B regulation protein RsbU (phosphoserine phosphatase)
MFKIVRGRGAIGESFERLFALFPDYSITMRDPLFICEGDRAAEFSTVTGTQRTALYGLPPTGQPIEYHAARLFTFANGLIAYEQRVYDFGGILERLEKTRIDRELATASAVQQLLMPQTDLRGAFFEVARASLPCRAISGDFLEYHHVPSTGFGIALGDVSGKGPPAALVAAMLHGMLATIFGTLETPGALLGRLNLALLRRNVDERYATLCHAVLAPDGRLTYSNAGHPPPILVRTDGPRFLTAGGPILGVFDHAVFPSETRQLAPGDSLVFYTDGVTDAVTADGREFGVDRLVAAVGAHAWARPAALVDGLLSAVRQFVGSAAPVDDATIAVIRYR